MKNVINACENNQKLCYRTGWNVSKDNKIKNARDGGRINNNNITSHFKRLEGEKSESGDLKKRHVGIELRVRELLRSQYDFV